MDTLHPGVVALRLDDPATPRVVYKVRVEVGTCAAEVRTVKAGDALIGLEPTRDLAATLERRTGRAALAAVNADFFSYDPPGVPAGLQVEAGEMVAPPSDRPVLGVTAAGESFIGHVRLDAGVRLADGTIVPLEDVNRPDADGWVLLNRFAPMDAAPRPGTIWLRPLDTPTGAGDTVRGLVVTVDTAPAEPAGATVRIAPPAAPAAAPAQRPGHQDHPGHPDHQDHRNLAAPGDTVRWWTGLSGPPGPLVDAVGGLPVLVRDGVSVVSEVRLSASFSDDRHPRTAAGWTADGALILVVADGRQPGYSDGMTLAELADLMVGLGVVDALNLDGGGSSTLVLRGVVANRPSDEAGERAVANALVVLAPPIGTCPDTYRP